MRGQPCWLGAWRGGSRCFYPPPPSALPVFLCACGPAPAGAEAPPLGSRQPAASLLLSPALCSAVLRRCGLARRRSFLRDNKSARSLFSTEDGSTLSPLTEGDFFKTFFKPIYKHWNSPYLFAVSDFFLWICFQTWRLFVYTSEHTARVCWGSRYYIEETGASYLILFFEGRCRALVYVCVCVRAHACSPRWCARACFCVCVLMCEKETRESECNRKRKKMSRSGPLTRPSSP